MAEQQVAFLYAAANSLQGTGKTFQLLKSFYLTRCKVIGGKGHRLPAKQFGPLKRCAHCSLEWRRGGYIAKILPLRKLKKSARRRLHQSEKLNKKDISTKIIDKLHSNSLERVCLFCHHKTEIKMLKPSSNGNHPKLVMEKNSPVRKNTSQSSSLKPKKSSNIEQKLRLPPKIETNVYCNSKSVFTSKYNKVIQPRETKPEKKAPRKSKKDKFAGLCREAVLASAKAKQTIDATESKLSLFLKKSL